MLLTVNVKAAWNILVQLQQHKAYLPICKCLYLNFEYFVLVLDLTFYISAYLNTRKEDSVTPPYLTHLTYITLVFSYLKYFMFSQFPQNLRKKGTFKETYWIINSSFSHAVEQTRVLSKKIFSLKFPIDIDQLFWHKRDALQQQQKVVANSIWNLFLPFEFDSSLFLRLHLYK